MLSPEEQEKVLEMTREERKAFFQRRVDEAGKKLTQSILDGTMDEGIDVLRQIQGLPPVPKGHRLLDERKN